LTGSGLQVSDLNTALRGATAPRSGLASKPLMEINHIIRW